MAIRTITDRAAQISALLHAGATREVIDKELLGLHISEFGQILELLEAEDAVRLFCLSEARISAQAIGEVSVERLVELLSLAQPHCVVPVLKQTSLENEKIAPNISDALPEVMLAKRMLIFNSLPSELGAEVFANLSSEARDELLLSLSDSEAQELLVAMTPDDRTGVLDNLPGEVLQRLLNLMPAEELKEIRTLLGYPEESIGYVMTPDYVAVRPHWTVHRALQHLRRQAEKQRETFDAIYVTDTQWKLLDALDLKRFVFADPEAKVEDLMDHSFVSVRAVEDREDAVEAMRRYDISVLPVVDTSGVLVGIVTFDDVLDIAEEEATEDFHKMGSVEMAGISLKDAKIPILYRARIGWLLVLVFVNILSGAGIAYFEDTLAATISLAIFLPLLIGSGGNAGAQSATLMVRAIATGQVTIKDWVRLFRKEITVALLLGVTMSAGVSLITVWRAPEIMFVVGSTMVATVLVGSLIGMCLPFILTKFKLDPATASAPLVTSMADIAGVLIYFSIARAVLGV